MWFFLLPFYISKHSLWRKAAAHGTRRARRCYRDHLHGTGPVRAVRTVRAPRHRWSSEALNGNRCGPGLQWAVMSTSRTTSTVAKGPLAHQLRPPHCSFGWTGGPVLLTQCHTREFFYIIYFSIFQKYIPQFFFANMASCDQFNWRDVIAGSSGGISFDLRSLFSKNHN